MPSEILKQRDELINALETVLLFPGKIKSLDDAHLEFDKAEELIKKSKKSKNEKKKTRQRNAQQ